MGKSYAKMENNINSFKNTFWNTLGPWDYLAKNDE